MNGPLVLAWAVIGLLAAAVISPTAGLLADVPSRLFHRAWIAAVTAVAFAALALRYSITPELLGLSVFAAVAVQLAVIDVLARRLPRVLIWPTCAIAAALLAGEVVTSGAEVGLLLRAVAGALALATGYLVVALVSRGGLGAGDVRAAVLVGGLLGWLGWSVLFAGAVLGFCATGVIGMMYAVHHRTPTTIPHGPGMFAGAFTALLL